MFKRNLLIAMLLFPVLVESAPVNTGEIEFIQTDGTTRFQGKEWGDEFWVESETISGSNVISGYVFKMDSTGDYTYAVLDSNENYIPSDSLVGINSLPSGAVQPDNLSATKKAEIESEINTAEIAYQLNQDSFLSFMENNTNDSCHIELGVILFEFRDIGKLKPATWQDGFEYQHFENMLFSNDNSWVGIAGPDSTGEDDTNNYPSNTVFTPDPELFGSMRQYFNQQSLEALDICGEVINTPDSSVSGLTVPKWVYLDGIKASLDTIYSKASIRHLVMKEFMKQIPNGKTILEEYINITITAYDTTFFEKSDDRKLAFVYAGEAINGHALHPNASLDGPYYTTNETKNGKFDHFGTHAHEFAHTIGFFDEYQGNFGGGSGQGTSTHRFDLMASGLFNGPGSYASLIKSCPSGINPYYRIKYGWVEADTIQSIWNDTLRYSYSDPNYLMVKIPGTNAEYFVYENRLRNGFDEYTVGGDFGTSIPNDQNDNIGGLLIWRVCFANTNDRVRLFYGDDTYDPTNNYFFTSHHKMPFPWGNDTLSVPTEFKYPTAFSANGLDPFVEIDSIFWHSDSTVAFKITPHPNVISTNTTWSTNQNLQDGALITNGAILTINPGVTVSVGIGKTLLFDEGTTLIAEGTQNSKIKFTCTDSTNMWQGVSFANPNDYSIEYCIFEKAVNAIDHKFTSGGLEITNSEFRNCTLGISLNYNSPDYFRLIDLEFDNLENAIEVSGIYSADSLIFRNLTLKDINNIGINVKSSSSSKIELSGLNISETTIGVNLSGFGSNNEEFNLINSTFSNIDSIGISIDNFYSNPLLIDGISIDSSLIGIKASLIDSIFIENSDFYEVDSIAVWINSNSGETETDNSNAFYLLSNLEIENCGIGSKIDLTTASKSPFGIIENSMFLNCFNIAISISDSILVRNNLIKGNGEIGISGQKLDDTKFVNNTIVGVDTIAIVSGSEWGKSVGINNIFSNSNWKNGLINPIDYEFDIYNSCFDNVSGISIADSNTYLLKDVLFTDPLFADTIDYELTSNYDALWIDTLGGVTPSPCIDTGIPYSNELFGELYGDFTNEPLPNGRRINMGYYGGTEEAEIKIDDSINGGVTTSNVTWSGNIILKNDFEVSEVDTLFIERGTTVITKFQDTTSPSSEDAASTLVELICKGTIKFLSDSLLDGKISLQHYSPPLAWYGIRYLDVTTNQTLKYVDIISPKNGIEFDTVSSSVEIEISECQILDFNDKGIYAHGNSFALDINRNTIARNSVSPQLKWKYCVYIDFTDTNNLVTITGNTFDGNKGNTFGIYVKGASVDISGNTFDKISQFGVWIINSSQNIVDNIFSSGIQIEEAVDSIYVRNNSFSGTVLDAIYLKDSNVTGAITGNTITGSTSSLINNAIYLSEDSDLDSIAYNSATNVKYGIYLDRATDNSEMVVKSNYLSGGQSESSQYGIYHYKTVGSKISYQENKIEDFAQGGMKFYNNNDLEVEIGIAEADTANTIQGESIYQMMTYGIIFDRNEHLEESTPTVTMRSTAIGYSATAILIKENNTDAYSFDFGTSCETRGDNSIYFEKSDYLIWNENSNIDVDGDGNYWADSSETLISDVAEYSKNFTISCFLNVDPWEGSITKIAGNLVPTEFSLSQNYPNPFNPTTMIKFGIPAEVDVRIDIYNILGQKVITLVDKKYQTGFHQVRWSGLNSRSRLVSSGVYFYRIKAGKFVKTKKLTFLK